MRYAFIKELTNLARENPHIILLTADLGYTVFEGFAKEFPKQFINVGVAESNMISVAAGLALSGKIVYAYSIATFATMRAFEQIRNDVCLHKAPVTIVGSGAGLSYADAGPTHHALEDIAIMRVLPNITILCPADPTETRWATRIATQLLSPVYLRLGKRGEPNLYDNKTTFRVGKASILKKGKDVGIIATGNIVANALEASRILEKKGLSVTLASMHTVKPLDESFIMECTRKYRLIVSIEEHSIIGGLGSAVSECVVKADHSKVKFLKIGVPDTFTQIAGEQTYIRDLYGLTPEKIAQRILLTYKKL